MTELTRRSLLAAVGVAFTAGCLTDGSDGPGGEGTTTATTGTTATTVFDGTTTTDSGGTPRTESRERKTTRTTRETTAGDWIEHASNQPDPDHAITVANEAAESKTVRVRVERDATGETVFDATETVESGVESTAWNLKKASPEGVEAFTVCAELVKSAKTTTATERTTADAERTTADAERTTADTERTTADIEQTTTTTTESRDCVTLRTNECYADAHVAVREDGSLRIIYAIC